MFVTNVEKRVNLLKKRIIVKETRLVHQNCAPGTLCDITSRVIVEMKIPMPYVL